MLHGRALMRDVPGALMGPGDRQRLRAQLAAVNALLCEVEGLAERCSQERCGALLWRVYSPAPVPLLEGEAGEEGEGVQPQVGHRAVVRGC
jgi:hypothetical protein